MTFCWDMHVKACRSHYGFLLGHAHEGLYAHYEFHQRVFKSLHHADKLKYHTVKNTLHIFTLSFSNIHVLSYISVKNNLHIA